MTIQNTSRVRHFLANYWHNIQLTVCNKLREMESHHNHLKKQCYLLSVSHNNKM